MNKKPYYIKSPPIDNLSTKFSKNFLYNNDSPELFTDTPNERQNLCGLGNPTTYIGSPKKGMKGASSKEETAHEKKFTGKSNVKDRNTKQPVFAILYLRSLIICLTPYSQINILLTKLAQASFATVRIGL